MTTEYAHNIALLVPEAHWASAGALIACISEEAADLMQFRTVKFGPDYDACNAQAKATHVAAVQAAIAGQFRPQRPAFDTAEEIDMAKLQAMIDGAQIVTSIPEEGITPVPGALIVGVDIDVRTLAAACGFESISIG